MTITLPRRAASAFDSPDDRQLLRLLAQLGGLVFAPLGRRREADDDRAGPASAQRDGQSRAFLARYRRGSRMFMQSPSLAEEVARRVAQERLELPRSCRQREPAHDSPAGTAVEPCPGRVSAAPAELRRPSARNRRLQRPAGRDRARRDSFTGGATPASRSPTFVRPSRQGRPNVSVTITKTFDAGERRHPVAHGRAAERSESSGRSATASASTFD
jgi:hypothetical protein